MLPAACEASWAAYSSPVGTEAVGDADCTDTTQSVHQPVARDHSQGVPPPEALELTILWSVQAQTTLPMSVRTGAHRRLTMQEGHETVLTVRSGTVFPGS